MKTISYDDYSALLDNSTIIIPGKVFQRHNGTILKVFRRKGFFSSGRLYPFALRFTRNAEKLQNRRIPSVRVEGTYRIPDLNKTAVLYRKLEGIVLDEWLANSPVSDKLAVKLADFIAVLHKKGIYFRSIHFGNIVVLPDGNFGLIDIHDMKIHRSQLSFRKRLRNFNHIFRNDADRKRMQSAFDVFLDHYNTQSLITESQAAKIRKRVVRLLGEPGQT